MDYNCLISIITVCYNAEKTIAKTIESVLNQNYDNYEYLIIDGASTDHTKDVFDKYLTSFKGRAFWYSEPDNGIYDAMNKGAQLATGRYLLFLNADDTLTDNALSLYDKRITQEGVRPDIIYGDSVVMYHNGEETKTKIRKAICPITLRSLRKGMGVVHQSMITSKELFVSLKGFNLNFTVGADWDFLIRSVRNDACLVYIDKPLSVFDLDGVSSLLHNKQRHQIRKENNLYVYFDWFMVVDYLKLSSLIQFIFGQSIYNKIRYYANKFHN